MGALNTAIWGSSKGPAGTSGWDTAYVVKVGAVNAALAKSFAAGDLPAETTFSESFQTGMSVQGTFGAWSITTGGGGSLLRLALPITQGTGNLSLLNLGQFNLAGCTVIVEASLSYHPVGTAPGAATPAASGTVPAAPALTAALKPAVKGAGVTHGSAASIQSGATTPTTTTPAASSTSSTAASTATIPPSPCTMTAVAINGLNLSAVPAAQQPIVLSEFQALFTTWLGSDNDLFDHVFLQLDVAETANTGAWSFITPWYVGYGYTDTQDSNGNLNPVDESLLAIFSMCTNTDLAGCSSTVTANAIPANSGVNAAFLIDPSVFMGQLLFPTIPGLFQKLDANGNTVNTTTADWTFDPVGLTVSNNSAITMSLQMDAATWGQTSATGTIAHGDLSVSLTTTNVVQNFAGLSIPYGAVANDTTVNITLTSASYIGLDDTGCFGMQYDPAVTPVQTMNVSVNQSAAAWESLGSIAMNLVLTLALSALPIGGGAGKALDGAGGDVAGGGVKPELPGAGEAGGGTEPNSGGGEPTGGGADAPGGGTTESEQDAAKTLNEDLGAGKPSSKVSIEMTEQPVASKETLTTPTAQDAEAEIKNPASQKLAATGPKFQIKMWAMVTAQLFGGLVGGLSNISILEDTQIFSDPESLPPLQNFLTNCIKPATWTNSGSQTLLTTGLNGAFVLGFSQTTPAASTTSATSPTA